jgi:hypothetical protein
MLVKENSMIPPALRESGYNAAMKLHAETLKNGGATLDLSTLALAAHTEGYYVGGAPNWAGAQIESVLCPIGSFTAAYMRTQLGYIYAEQLELSPVTSTLVGTPEALIGTWEHDGIIYIDVVNHFESITAAITAARYRNQLAIWDIERGAEIHISQLIAI